MSAMPEPMDEGRRQAYLAALGIPLWSSRQDLPGAAASSGLAFTPFWADSSAVDESFASLVLEPAQAESAAPTPAGPPSASAEVAHAPSRQSPFSMAETAPSDALTAAKAEPVAAAKVPPIPTPAVMKAPVNNPAMAAANSANHAFPRFSCRVQWLAPGTIVLVALDDVPDLSAQEYHLLENLMLALGGDPLADAQRESFRWPLVANPKLPRDADAAREALAAFLGRRRGVARWLVLGETLAVYVRAALSGQAVVAAPSLRELLLNPAAKRQLWQALNG